MSSCKERCFISGALLPLSVTFPFNWTPSSGSPSGPQQRETPIYRTFYIPSPENSAFPQESPLREPCPCSITRFLWIEILHHQSHWSIYSCMSAGVPKKEPSYKMGKNIRSLSTEPQADRRPTYNGVQPGSPRGSLTTLLSLPQCHAALAWYLPPSLG